MVNTTTHHAHETQPSVAEALLDALDGVDANTPGGSLIFLIVGGLVETEIQLRDETLARIQGRADGHRDV